MDLFLHQTLAGLATGGIYALMALAIVMIYRATSHLNFAQGEMATIATFVAWQFMQWGASYWLAFAATILLAFVGGMATERIVFRPVREATAFAHIAIYIALFSILNSASGFIWDASIKTFPSPFGTRPLFAGLISTHDAGMIAVTITLIVCLSLFFRFTRTGLGMRAAVADPVAARLSGIDVGMMTALGWGMAAAIGAVAGMLIAPVVFLEPNMMVGILVYGFAGAALGGLNSPAGAVLGGVLVGVIENLAGTYVPVIGREMKLSIALALIVVALLLRPTGLFERDTAARA
jgi:branched-chain amino acid transport system permease protein